MSTVGCGKMTSHEELAERLLNERYGEEFTVETIQSTSLFRDSYTAVAYQNARPEIPFKVHVENNGSGLSDNYVTRLVCNQLSDVVARNLDSLNGIYYTYSRTMINSYELRDPNISLNEYISTHPMMSYDLFLFYNPDTLDKENFYHGLSNICQGIPISGDLYVYIVGDRVLADVQEYLENNDEIYDEGESLFEPYFCGHIGFTDGVLDNSKEEIFEMIEGR